MWQRKHGEHTHRREEILDEGDVVADSGRALGRERPAVPAVQQHAIQHVAHSLHGT
jgi:hypothetical protein